MLTGHNSRLAGLVLILLVSSLITLPACQTSKGKQPTANKPYTVLLVPLDSRPVNTQHVQLLAGLAGFRLLQPPADLLDNYTDPSDTAGLLSWLAQNLNQADAAIIATNNLLTGGLIASRHPNSYLDLESKLGQFETLLQQYPKTDVTLINVLPRQLPTQFSNAGWTYRQQLTRYGQLTDKTAQGLTNPAERSELVSLEHSLPKQILQDYLGIYTANSTIDQRLLSLISSGAVDRLVLTLDDAAPFGLANQVQRELTQLAKERNVSGQLFALTGADETSMLALARLVTAANKVTPSFQLHYERSNDAEILIRLETRPLNWMISEKIVFVGGVVVAQQAENQLFIHARVGTRAVPATARALKDYHDQGLQTGVLDIALVNQSDAGFTDELYKQATADAIDSYAGWNTASNSIGSVVAHLAVRSAIRGQLANFPATSTQLRARLSADLEYRFLHMADEYSYLALVKPHLTKWSISQHISTDQIPPEQMTTVDSQLATLMQPYLENLAKRFSGPFCYRWGPDQTTTLQVANWLWQVKLPWPRLFEVQVEPLVEFQP